MADSAYQSWRPEYACSAFNARERAGAGAFCTGARPRARPAGLGLRLAPVQNAPAPARSLVHNLLCPNRVANLESLQKIFFNNKNCSALPVKKSLTYLLRASVCHGNYDNAAMPPSFQISVETTIVENITTSSTELVYTELLDTAQSNVTFLCLLRNNSSLLNPFISALSMKPIENLYEKFNEYLAAIKYMTIRTRLNFGGSALIRYLLFNYAFILELFHHMHADISLALCL